jgi:hypothetical protein
MAQTIFGGTPDPAGAFSSASAGVSDIFAGFGAQTKAQGDLLEGQNYGLAAQLALQEAAFTKQSTATQEVQLQRETTKALGQTRRRCRGRRVRGKRLCLRPTARVGFAGRARQGRVERARAHY